MQKKSTQLARSKTCNKKRNKDRCRQQAAPKGRKFVEYKGYTAILNTSSGRVVLYRNGWAVHVQSARKDLRPEELMGIIDSYIRRKYGKAYK